jgi:protein tyrosine phosphatase
MRSYSFFRFCSHSHFLIIYRPLTVHCNNGVGRTGAIIACDIVLRYLEVSRQIDIPQIVYKIRRDRANSIRTKDQYEFIYHIANAYAATLTTSNET